jgi:DNA-binding transcriptional ArsR family regulator
MRMATTTTDRTADDAVSLAFAALADPTRRDLLSRLAGGEMTLSELAGAYAMSLQAVSKHLAVLERAGLVSRGRDAQRRPVRLEPEAIAPVAEWLERYQRAAEDRYRRLDALLAALPPDDPEPSSTQHRPQPSDDRTPS